MSYIRSAIKSLNLYTGTISCAPAYSGDKDVTITALTDANKAVIIPACGPAATATGYYPPFIATTDGNLKWAYVYVNSTTVVRFKTVVNTDGGVAHTITYAFWVLEY